MRLHSLPAAVFLFAHSACLSEGLNPCHEYLDSLAMASKKATGDRWVLDAMLKWSQDTLKRMAKGDRETALDILNRKQREIQGFQDTRLKPSPDSLESFCKGTVVVDLSRDISKQINNIEISLGLRKFDPLGSCNDNLEHLRKQLDRHWRFLKLVNVSDVLKWLQAATLQDVQKLLNDLSRAQGDNLENSVLDPLLREVAGRAATDPAYKRLLEITLLKELERIKLEQILEAALHDDKRFNDIIDAMNSKGLTGDIVRKVMERSDDREFVAVMHDLARERNMEILENVLASKRLAMRLLEDSAAMAELADKYTEQIRSRMRTLDAKAGSVGIIPPLALQYTPEFAARVRDTLAAHLHAGLQSAGINTVRLTGFQEFEAMREELQDSLRSTDRGGGLDLGLLGRLKRTFEPGPELLALVQADYWPSGEDSVAIRLRWIDLGTGLVLGTGRSTTAIPKLTPPLAREWMESLRESANSRAAARIYMETLATRHIITLDRNSSRILQFGRNPVGYTDFGGLSGIQVAKISKISFEPWLGGVSGIASYKEYHATLEQRLRSFRPDRLVFVTSARTGNDQIRLSVDADPEKKGNVRILGRVNTAKLFSISVECPTDSQWLARGGPDAELSARYHLANSAVLTLLSAYLEIGVREAPFRWSLWYGLVPLGIPHLVKGFTAKDNLDKTLYFATGVSLGAADLALAYYFWNEILVRDQGDYVRTRHELNMRSMEGLAWGTIVGAVRLASLATYIWFDEQEAKRPSRLSSEIRVDEDRISLGAAYHF